jgi:cyclopropane fatty-acyl-phospholipid synthase-like methyltransferase
VAQQLERCRLCRCPRLDSVLSLGEQHLTGVFPATADADISCGPLDLVFCGECHLLQLGHRYEPTEMYGENYGYRSGLNQSMVTHLARKVEALEALVGLQSGDVVLDIGSNDGTLLRAYRTPGLTRIGIDPTSAKFAQYYPNDVIRGAEFFDHAAFERLAPSPAKVITSIAMFYDLDEPAAFARDVASSLAPDGVWHFEQSYMPSMLRSMAYDTVCHEHLEYYSLETVERILTEAGLELVDVRFNRINGGSFAVTAAHAGTKLRTRSELIDWFRGQEKRFSLDSLAPYHEFAHRVAQHRDDLKDLVRLLRHSGATIDGLGASTKGNVLLQYCNFGPDDIRAIGEVNPSKFGLFTPGTGIPIVPEDEIRTSDPDYILVLPWHFREGIVEREQEYLRKGGRLIFPLPEIEIVGDR